MPLRCHELPRKHVGAKEKAGSPKKAACERGLGGLSPQDGGTREADEPRQDGAQHDGAREDGARHDGARQDATPLVRAQQVCRTVQATHAGQIGCTAKIGGGGRSEKAASVEVTRAPWTLTALFAATI